MSAARQLRPRKLEANTPADREARIDAATPEPNDPIQLLRDAIERLKSSNGKLLDQAQVAGLLAEAREALEHANVVARSISQCEHSLEQSQFDKAFEALDAGLTVYPSDPVLIARRHKAEEQKKELQYASAVQTAIEESQWLLAQDRVDLALDLLKSKADELPAQAALISGVEELEALLPEWEQKRHVHVAVERAVALDNLEQGQAALTILEEALQRYPTSGELIVAAKHVRERLEDHGRKKKLTRRLQLIEQKIAAQSWREAGTLLKDAQKEFPDTPELSHLEFEVDDGLIRSEREAVATEMRRCLADGEIEQAEQIFRRGVNSFGPGPSLELLREELESTRQYREALRAAQILFARGSLDESERVLTQVAAPGRPEAEALLNAVKAARAAADEENFCERGRDKALKLIQDGQFAQASDLLENLLSLFPDNPILERDLVAARSRLSEVPAEIPPTDPEESSDPPSTASEPSHTAASIIGANKQTSRVGPPQRSRRVAIAGGGLLVLASAAGAAWELSRNTATIPKPGASQAAQHPGRTLYSAAQNSVTSSATLPAGIPPERSDKPVLRQTQAQSSVSTDRKTPHQPSSTTPLRAFIPETTRMPVQTPASQLPPPPTAPISAAPQAATPSAEVIQIVNTPAPPPDAPPPAKPTSSATSAPAPAKPPLPPGGRFQEAQLVERTLPEYPALARQIGAGGLVRISAVIDEHGIVKDAKAVSGHPMLAEAARRAVLRWKYTPATLDGQPIATTARIEIRFSNGN